MIVVTNYQSWLCDNKLLMTQKNFCRGDSQALPDIRFNAIPIVLKRPQFSIEVTSLRCPDLTGSHIWYSGAEDVERSWECVNQCKIGRRIVPHCANDVWLESVKRK